MEQRVLLIEDNEAEASLFRYVCEDIFRSTDVVIIPDGHGAVEYVKRCEFASEPHPKLIILDLNLPGMSGFEVLDYLKRGSCLNHVPVIIFSTTRSVEHISSAYARSASCFISKPLDLDDYTRICKAIYQFWFSTATLPL